MKKTNTRRIAAWLATVLMVATVMTACGESGTATDPKSADTSTEAAETTVMTDGLPDKDMGGFSFNILHHNKEWLTWAETMLTATEETGDILNDAMYKRTGYIEERFNCTLNFTEVKQVSSIFAQSVLSGDNEFDICFQYGINVLGNVDYLADMSKIPYLNLEADYWNPNASGIFKIGDKQVALAGNWSLSYLSGSNGFLFNKNIYEDLQIKDNLYDLVREGKWTTDKFFEIAEQAALDLNGDTVMDSNDRFGATGSCKAFFNWMITGAGLKYVTMDKDGYPVFDVPGNEKTISFFQKLLDYVNNKPYSYYNPSTNVDNGGFAGGFVNDQVLFQQNVVYSITGQTYRDMQSDFGILPSPKYDEAQEKYYSYTNIGEIATLPRSYDASRLDNIGILMEAMSFYSQQNIVDVYKKVILQTKMTRDDDSAEMLQYVFDGISFDYGIVVWQNDVGNVFMNKVFMPKSDTITSTIASIQSVLDAKIETLKEAVAEMP